MLFEYKPSPAALQPISPINLTLDPSIRRILIVKWSAMGDVVLSTAAMQDVRAAFPKAELHLNTHPAWMPLFQDDPRFSHVFGFDFKRPGKELRNTVSWLRKVRDCRYDLVIDLQSNQRSRNLFLTLKLMGCLPRHLLGVHKRRPYTVYPSRPVHPLDAISKLRQALRAAGIPTVTPKAELHIPHANRRRCRELSRFHKLEDRQYAVLLPGSQAAGHLKRWGVRNYADLSRLLLESGIQKVVLVGGPEEMAECRSIAEAVDMPGLVNLCGQTQILDIVPLCATARFVVGNDTGTAHVASASGTPLLVLCGPTDPRRVLPPGDAVWGLQANITCINCYRKTCYHKTCMEMITPRNVLHFLRSKGLIS